LAPIQGLMIYSEHRPSTQLTDIIECYWELELNSNSLSEESEFFPPDCTFDIILSYTPFYYKFSDDHTWKKSPGNKVLFGLRSKGISFYGDYKQVLFGIRLKAFALYPWANCTMQKLNDAVFKLNDIVDLNRSQKLQLELMVTYSSVQDKCSVSNSLFKSLDSNFTHVDQCLRERVNYILDRKGSLKIGEMYAQFNISKYSLQRQFIKKIGISPKLISKIWRFNYFLNLRERFPNEKMTILGIEAGYYDQAHLIRDFKSFLFDNPKSVFANNRTSLAYSQKVIHKRFNNLYDPMTT
jgi:AraC-like DNA-binding protein